MVFAGAYIWREANSPGLSIGAALVLIPGLLAAFGFVNCHESGITRDAKAAAVVAFFSAIGAAAYMVIFFTTWLPAVIVWVLTFIPLPVAVAKSPTAA